MPEQEIRASKPEHSSSSDAVRVLCGIAGALGAVLVVLSLWVVVQRFRYPIDAEWMTGAMRDGIDRVRDGKGLYGPPTARFIPFVYPPLYFGVAAFAARFVSTFVAAKLVSIGATLAAGWGLYRISRTLGATLFWSRVAVLLHVATYSLTIFFYDLERVDAFYAAMIVVGLALVFAGESRASMIASGAILGLAFFAKQAGVLAFAAVVVGLVVAGQRKRAAIVGGTGAALALAVFGYLEVRTGGWFRFYCLTVPGVHGIRAQRLSIFFIQDVPKAFVIATGSMGEISFVVAALARRWFGRRKSSKTSERERTSRRERTSELGWQTVVFAAVLAAGMAASFVFRAHSGGWPNVLVAWLPLGCAATASAATRIEARARGTTMREATSLLLLTAVILQLLGAVFDPTELSPNAGDLAERDRFVALVRRLETQGEVLVTTMGNVTSPTSAHAAALYDIMRAGTPAPQDLLDGLERQRYAALFVGSPDELECPLATCEELANAVTRNYFVAGRRHERDRTGMTGYDARPRWLLRPRKTPLSRAIATPLLRRRARVEEGFAQMTSAETPMDTEITPSEDIEDRAARELESAL